MPPNLCLDFCGSHHEIFGRLLGISCHFLTPETTSSPDLLDIFFPEVSIDLEVFAENESNIKTIGNEINLYNLATARGPSPVI
jgi:hypothetical protein